MATQPITIGANSIARIGDRFFLIVEVEAKAPGVEIDPVFAVRTTPQQARSLINAGVMRTIIQNRRPQARPGTKVEFKGVLSANGRFFSVFDVENSTDISVLVRISRERAQRLIRNGARRIPVIRRTF
ncbi:hypothetical protein BRE01_31120 [Brevibacillus reuszeri]|uniref:Uncharacterized protein n=1 Tax=Brevibacillus reuszeri TaxID=54915 RepID=A0A0K9YZU9_9BACL|nr:hypothetical protein [Brevibacillus reuszeri]KNB73750.1 hypothetical protein ADS79_07380 [Brevibacillus reuszeri]MED1858435.1 hypothetical protein [Brevibacillus reuszeri]GED69410.1 hypothetical protein BRE01_31120 [Brevibacillus reuszeri]